MLPPISIVRTPILQVYDVSTSTWVSDNTGNLAATPPGPVALSASCTHGYDQHIASAEVHFATMPTGVNYWDDLQITMGAVRQPLGGGMPISISYQRFQGFTTDFDWTLWPREVVMKCSGHLILADRFENQNGGGTQVAGTGTGVGQAYGTATFTPGQTDAPLTPTTNPSLSMGHIISDSIVKTVLYLCGITNAMMTAGGASTILGTGQTLGTVATQDFLWSQGESGLSYIQRLEEICLGYRTFDALDGTVVRQKVQTAIQGGGVVTPWSSGTAYVPNTVVSVTIGPTTTYYNCIAANTNQMPPNAAYWKVAPLFTEGVDIFTGKSPRSVLPLRNGVLAQGYTESDGTTHTKQRTLPTTYVPTPPGVIWQDLTSRLMECTNSLDLGAGVAIACDSAAGWLLGELVQLQVRLDFETYREDLIEPGDLVVIAAPSRLDLMTTPLWVQSVTNAVSTNGAYTQRLGCLRGAP